MSSQKNKYLLAVSGGVDSCVLLDIFLKKNYDFIVIHFNHLTRGQENIIEANHVKKMCEINNIKFFQFNYRHELGNFQSSARTFRMSKYRELIDKYDLRGVVLAHHLDDNFENMQVFSDKFFNLMEKVSIYNGLKIYRPLLDNTKKEIYEYAKLNNVVYFEDSSNKKDKYIRNFHRIKNYHISDDLKKKEVKAAINKQKRNKRIKIDDELTKEVFEKSKDKELILFLFIKNKFPQLNVKKQLISDIIESLSFQGNKKFDIGNNIILVQQYDILFLKENIKLDKVNKQKLLYGTNNFNGLIFENKCESGYIRTRKSNDFISLKNGTKKVTRYMIDNKIPSEIRDIYPIVVDEKDEVLYIPKIVKK